MKKYSTKNDFYPSFLKGIAHRGLHNEKFTENGLNAFKNAIDNDFDFELDIHLTKDNELIVCHDSELKRTCGKEGIIEELTLNEIKDNYSLLDGEKVPTLKEVLDLNKEKQTIVIELKPRKNYKKLAKKALEEVSSIKDKKKITFISFDPRCLVFLKNKGYEVGLLLTHTRKDVAIFHKWFNYLDIDEELLSDKRIKKYLEKGHVVNVWTIRDIEKYKELKEKVSTITFELIEPSKVKELYK